MPVSREKFRNLVDQHLLPLFSGAGLAVGFETSTERENSVALVDPCSLRIKPSRADNYGVIMRRSQPFARVSSGYVTEHAVTRAFVSVLNEISPGIGSAYEYDLLSALPTRVVARSVCSDRGLENTVLQTLGQLDLWSNRLYEGQPIVTAIGFESLNEAGLPHLRDLWQQEFGSVLTNGFDTLIVAGEHGGVNRYESLPVPEVLPPYAPHRLAPVADWASGGRLAITLNRIGEICVIRDKKLVFAKRGGLWHFLTHEPVITQMSCPQNNEIRDAIYASTLDASFARTGACVGVVTSNNLTRVNDVIPRPDDRFAYDSLKSSILRRIVGSGKFQDLDRRLRQELLAIDGATIIDHEGGLVAVGAILRIPGGSTGGGRLAAAIELSRFGLGIKVSQDGGIKGFYHTSDPDTAVPKFFVM